MDNGQRRFWLLPLMAVVWNQLVYGGGQFLTRNVPHLSLELGMDRVIPFLPWTVSIYLGCFLFCTVLYLLFAWQDRAFAYRFFCADLLAKGVCLLFFLLLPTTNLRPPVPGDTLWDHLMRFVYQVDPPSNLFPSIHCLVSWFCFIGARSCRRFPPCAVVFTGAAAVLICLSTLTTRQHVMADVMGGILLAEISWKAAGHPKIFRRFSRCMDHIVS